MQQEQILVIAAVIAVIVLAIVIWYVLKKRRTEALRDRFGEEYDHAVHDRGRREAEENLAERERRVSQLDIRPLTADERDRYTHEWKETKSLFVDSPAEAVLRADRSLADMMKTRGFPMGDFDRRYEDLSVDHPDVARHYREGHALTVRHNEGNASTEDLRQAIKHYELLFEELVRDAGSDHDHDHDRHAVEHHDHDLDHDDRPREGVSTRDMAHDRHNSVSRRVGDGVDRPRDLDEPRPTVPARPRN